MILWFGFLYSYSTFATTIMVGLELVGLPEILLMSPKFYIVIITIPAINLFRDVFWKVYKRMFKYEPYHIAQELQAIELKPLKPRILSVVDKMKIIGKIKSGSSNTYAFSQSERTTLERLRSTSKASIEIE